MERIPKNLAATAACSASLLLVLARPAFCEDHRERAHWHGDIHYFHEHDLSIWRGGHWYHGAHVGRAGWWWVVNGIWYFYPRRVAVIPSPYVPPTVTVQLQAAPPAEVVAEPDPATPPQSWYYCKSPHGYYPYVTTCTTGWVMVPVTPPPVQ